LTTVFLRTTNKAIDTSANLRDGGGIYADLRGFNGNTETTKPKLEIIDTTIEGNEAGNDGGGLWVCTKYGAEFNLINSTVSGNTAGTVEPGDFGDPSTVVGGHGGGVWLGVQGFDVDDLDLDATFENVTISGSGVVS